MVENWQRLPGIIINSERTKKRLCLQQKKDSHAKQV
jgi:hypothetical protein